MSTTFWWQFSEQTTGRIQILIESGPEKKFSSGRIRIRKTAFKIDDCGICGAHNTEAWSFNSKWRCA